MSRLPKGGLSKRQARRLIWERLAATVETDVGIGDWVHDEPGIPKDGEGNISDAAALALEEASADIADYIRRRFVEVAPARTRPVR